MSSKKTLVTMSITGRGLRTTQHIPEFQRGLLESYSVTSSSSITVANNSPWIRFDRHFLCKNPIDRYTYIWTNFQKLVVLGWIVAFGTMLSCVWGPYWRILPSNPNAPIIEGAFYEPLSRASWACAIGWIVWACYNGHGGVINDFLSWSFFQGFARLSYCMYVIHRIVQLVNGARIQHDTTFGDYEAVSIIIWCEVT